MTPTDHKTPVSPLKRIAVLLLAGVMLHILFLHWGFLASPSERFHALVPLLWLLDATLTGRIRSLGRVRSGAVFVGVLLGAVIFFWNVAAMQAQLAGGRTDWVEPLYKISLVLSCFVLYGVLAKTLTWLLCLWTRVRNLIDTPRGWWLRLIRVSVAILLFAPYLFTTFNVHRFKVGNIDNPQSQFKLPYETVHFPAAQDDVSLSGWLVPCPRSNAVVVVCHGIGGNKSTVTGVIPFLHRAGFNVFLFDFRGHGDSVGHTTSFGYYEARDVRGAVRYLSQTRGFKHIALYGFSMGGAAILHTMADAPPVQGVIVDSTFAEFPPLVQQQFSFMPLPMQQVLTRVTDFYSRLELGVSIEQMSSRSYVPKVSPRPLLIIHGTSDQLIDYTQAQANFAAARQPKTLWLVAGANHCGCRTVEKARYDARVTRFLKGCFH